MARVVIALFITLLNLILVSCDQEVHWEGVPQIRSIAIRGSDRAWLVTVKGDLQRTEDRGKTWRKTPAEIVGGFQSAAILDDRSGLAVGNRGRVWSTDDGGETWAVKSELKAQNWYLNESHQMHFVDRLHGWIIETLSIWRTEDGGTNWQKAFSPYEQKTKGQPVRAFFIDSHHVWVCGTDGEVYSTGDGGKTWLIQAISGKNSDFRDVFFINEKTGWLVGYTGGQFNNLLYRTDDGGKTWKSIQTNIQQTHLTSLYFLNEKDGWACGEPWSNGSKVDSGKGVLLHTTDGGQSWQSVFTTDVDGFFDRIQFLDQREGWLLGRDSVYRTDDSGKSWKAVLKLPPIKKT